MLFREAVIDFLGVDTKRKMEETDKDYKESMKRAVENFKNWPVEIKGEA